MGPPEAATEASGSAWSCVMASGCRASPTPGLACHRVTGSRRHLHRQEVPAPPPQPPARLPRPSSPGREMATTSQRPDRSRGQLSQHSGRLQAVPGRGQAVKRHPTMTKVNQRHQTKNQPRALIRSLSWWATDESTCTPDSVPGTPVGAPAAAIHLGLPLPAGSSGLPADIGRAALKRLRGSSSCGDGPFLALLRVGFTEPPRSPGVLVGSYPTVSPLPSRYGPAVCFLWHCPAGHPGLPLATTLPCGVRTFLGDGPEPVDATARSTRPSRPHPNDGPAAPISTPPTISSATSGRWRHQPARDTATSPNWRDARPNGRGARPNWRGARPNWRGARPNWRGARSPPRPTSLGGPWISPTPRSCSPPVSPRAL